MQFWGQTVISGGIQIAFGAIMAICFILSVACGSKFTWLDIIATIISALFMFVFGFLQLPKQVTAIEMFHFNGIVFEGLARQIAGQDWKPIKLICVSPIFAAIFLLGLIAFIVARAVKKKNTAQIEIE